MTHALSRPARLAGALALAAFLAACGGGQDIKGVRDGPQAVHPSPSELAKTPLYACGTQGQPACG